MFLLKPASLIFLALGISSLGVSPEAWLPAQAEDPLVLVVNRANAAAADMNKNEAKRLLLGEMSVWPSGAKVVIVLRPAGSPERTAVLSKVCNMSEAEYTRHNLQAQFMGQSVAEVHQEASSAATKSFVRSNPGAVAFLHKSEVDDNEKIVWMLP